MQQPPGKLDVHLIEDDFWSQVVWCPAQCVRPFAVWKHFGKAQVRDLDVANRI